MQAAALEWCERRLLARIHRMTLAKLRNEIAPVMPVQYMHWLLSWQHAASGSQLCGERGLLEIIRQLQGIEIPANAWESQIFAKRVKHYDSSMLDQLCISGTVGWGRLSTPVNERLSLRSNVPITFFVRNELDWVIRDAIDLNSFLLSQTAKKVYEFLQQQGASFFNDILHAVCHLKSELENALWELVTAGLVTADSFDNLRGFINPKRRMRQHRIKFSWNGGRWSLLRLPDIHNKEKRLEAVCWLLLKRYGVVFRDLLKREKRLPPWRELLITLRHMEDRGEIRGGRFVAGFMGEQFALPYAMSSLRSASHQKSASESITISAVDPLNLVGVILPGERFSALSKKTITFEAGAVDQSHQ